MTVKEIEIRLQTVIDKTTETIEMLSQSNEQQKILLIMAKQIIEDLVDEDPCEFDHHGYCQAHSWLDNAKCPHSRAKNFLKDLKEMKNEPRRPNLD